jgi:uncharacterized protein YbaA (DUF1428 family)
MENKTEFSVEMQKARNYLQHFIYGVPKENHDAIVRNLKQFIPWFEKQGARVEYYQLGKSETNSAIDSAKQSGMDFIDSIDKLLHTRMTSEGGMEDRKEADEEEIWIEQQYFRDYEHCREVYANMMQDKSLEPLGNEFFGLITKGRKMITGGFNRLTA